MRSVRHFIVAIFLVVVAAGTSCKRGGDPSSSPGETEDAQAPLAPAPLAVSSPSQVPSSPSSSALASSGSASPPLAPLAPGTFRCGTAACVVGKESCCTDGAVDTCVPTVPPGEGDKVQLLASQIEVCGEAHLPHAISGIKRCGDAADCRKAEACCVELMFSGATATVCKPVPRSGASPCGIEEACTSSCKAKGAACVEGVCQKPVAALRCDGATCSADKPVCCGSPPKCRTAAECPDPPRYACSGPRDCLAGEHCASSVIGTRCTRLMDAANTEVVCDVDRDCPRDACDGRARARCAASPGLWFKTCACP
jgi:hypothetical protein